jgi:fatty acid kinase fatty acid binding subunit
MTVRVVTDSTADLPRHLAQELGITVVPAHVLFGQETFRDRVDIDEDEFYRRLVAGPVHPTTSVPSPEDFAAAYRSLAKETDEIVSVHISSKLSGTCESAAMGAQLAGGKCRIEVVDSKSMGMGLMLTAVAAGREAKSGSSLARVVEEVQRAALEIHNLAMADTLKYAVKGGRVGKAYGLLGTALRIRVLLGVRDGNVYVSGIAPTRARALESLYQFALSSPDVKEIAVGYATESGDAEALSRRLKTALPQALIYVARVGPAVGAHGGPGAMGIAIRTREAKRSGS